MPRSSCEEPSSTVPEAVGECMRSPIVSPHLIHYKPKSRRREQIDAKDHWTPVTPDYLAKEFSKARDTAHAYDHVPVGERPTFHEIRALGAWLYEQQKFPQEYIQALMGHADEKMAKHYQEGHDEKKIESLEVGAELAFCVGVLQKFCKSQKAKKGHRFR